MSADRGVGILALTVAVHEQAKPRKIQFTGRRHHSRRPRPGPARRPPRPAPRLPRRHPRHHPAPVPRNPGQIITTDNAITVRLERRAYSPVLRQAGLPDATTVPWWGNRTLRYEFT